MTEKDMIRMLGNRVNNLLEQVKSLKIELEERNAVIREFKSTERCMSQALLDAKGGLQVRKENQSHVENLRSAVEGLILTTTGETQHFDEADFTKAVVFGRKVLDITKGASF